MDSIQATRLRKGNLVKMNGELYRVLQMTHVTPGKGRAFVQTRMRNVRVGTLLDHKFRSADMLQRAVLDDREMQFSYRDGETFHFMDLETYDQIEMSAETLGNFRAPRDAATARPLQDGPACPRLPPSP